MIRLSDAQLEFVTERHLATLTTTRPDGRSHVVPVAFTWDPVAGVVRITTRRTTTKVANARRREGAPEPRAAICQVDGRRWLTLEGTIEVSEDPVEVAEAVRRYAVRYRPRDHDPERVVLRLRPEEVMSSRRLR